MSLKIIAVTKLSKKRSVPHLLMSRVLVGIGTVMRGESLHNQGDQDQILHGKTNKFSRTFSYLKKIYHEKKIQRRKRSRIREEMGTKSKCHRTGVLGQCVSNDRWRLMDGREGSARGRAKRLRRITVSLWPSFAFQYINTRRQTNRNMHMTAIDYFRNQSDPINSAKDQEITKHALESYTQVTIN